MNLLRYFILGFLLPLTIISGAQDDAEFLISVYSKTETGYNQKALINSNNEIYLTGSILGNDTIYIDGPFEKKIIEPNRRNTVSYIIKANISGNILWVRHFNGSESMSIADAALLSDGNLILTGTADGSVDYQPGDGVKNATVRGTQLYLMKLDNAGFVTDFKVTEQVALRGRVLPNKLEISDNGTIYVFGGTESGADFDFDSGVVQASNERGNDGEFVVAYDANFAVKWVKLFNIDNMQNFGFASNKDNGVTLIGEHRKTIDGDPGSDTTALGFDNSFVQSHIIALKESGEVRALGFFGTPFHETRIQSVSIVDEGLLVNCRYQGFSDASPLISDSIVYGSYSAEYAVFVDNDLRVQWSDTNRVATAIFNNPLSESYSSVVAGKYGDLDFKNNLELFPYTRPPSIGPTVIDYDKDLNYYNLKTHTGGGNGFEVMNASANSAYIAFSGRAYKTLNWGPNAVKTHSNLSSRDPIFGLVKNTSEEAPNTVSEINGLTKSIIIYPNPAKDVININIENVPELKNLSIHDVLGRMVLYLDQANYNTPIPVDFLEKGVFILRVETTESDFSSKFIIE